MKHDVRDPQVDLVRRYARMLRSAPAEALRAQQRRTLAKASSVPAAVTGGTADPVTAASPRARRPARRTPA